MTSSGFVPNIIDVRPDVRSKILRISCIISVPQVESRRYILPYVLIQDATSIIIVVTKC